MGLNQPAMATNRELNERLERLEQLIAELGDLHPNLQRLQELLGTEEDIKRRTDEALTAASDAQTKASELLASTESTKKEVDDLKAQSKTIQSKATKSADLLLERLGIANAEVLARSFADQADEVAKSSKGWWKSSKIWVGALFFAILGVVSWETIDDQEFAVVGFILKLAIVSPIAYLAYSASKQHRIETTLRHQYNFKAAVASSLESYRQLLADNIAEDPEGDKIPKRQDALTRLLEQRIAAIFREPLENLIIIEDDESHDGLIIGYQGRAYRSLRNILSRPRKKSE